MKAAILGAGNWGTTLAVNFARQGHQINLWEFDAQQAELVQRTRRNERFLPGVDLPDGVRVTSILPEALEKSRVVFLSIPTQTSRSVLRQIRSLPSDSIIVSLMKGIEQNTRARVSQICREELADFNDGQYAMLSGPTIAGEVAHGLPTSAVIASTSENTSLLIQKEFSSSVLRLYRSDDVVGVEIAGAVKNVIALASGMCAGMQLGYNTMGALLTRGLAEISRLGEALGGHRITFSGLSGMGDLITTCNSPASRNRTVGERIGRGETLNEILNTMVMVAEGVWTSRAVRDLAAEKNIVMPITDAVCRILFENHAPDKAVKELMERRLKAED
jgi:glycerol-3-phosphate dehydrogenase (NAD(P)+)